MQWFTDQARAIFLEQSGDPVAAQQLALQVLGNLREQQASALAYFDCFWVFAMVDDLVGAQLQAGRDIDAQ